MSKQEATDCVIRTKALAKTFALGFFRKKTHAVRGVDLEVTRGEIFGLLGPNGAGKTTTIKILLGLLRANSGTAELLGKPVGDVEAKRRLGYLPESPYFYEYLTARELLLFTAELFSLERSTGRRRAGQLLEQVGLEKAADRPLRRFSKGMLQRIGLAQALINNPDLVILDEPLTGLDPIGRKHVRELVGQLRSDGKTVMLSSHILSDVELLADRVAILVDGRTVDTGRMDQLLDPRLLSQELVIRKHNEGLLQLLRGSGHRVEALGENAQIVVDGNTAVDPVIDLIRQHGCTLVSLTPRKESLEDVVVGKAMASGSANTAGKN